MCSIKHNDENKKNRSRSDAAPENHRTEHSSPQKGEAMEPGTAVRQIRDRSGLYRKIRARANECKRRYPRNAGSRFGREASRDHAGSRVENRVMNYSLS